MPEGDFPPNHKKKTLMVAVNNIATYKYHRHYYYHAVYVGQLIETAPIYFERTVICNHSNHQVLRGRGKI